MRILNEALTRHMLVQISTARCESEEIIYQISAQTDWIKTVFIHL